MNPFIVLLKNASCNEVHQFSERLVKAGIKGVIVLSSDEAVVHSPYIPCVYENVLDSRSVRLEAPTAEELVKLRDALFPPITMTFPDLSYSRVREMKKEIEGQVGNWNKCQLIVAPDEMVVVNG